MPVRSQIFKSTSTEKVIFQTFAPKIDVFVKTDNDKLGTEAQAAVSKWTVRPFSYNGTARKMRGVLYYRKPN